MLVNETNALSEQRACCNEILIQMLTTKLELAHLDHCWLDLHWRSSKNQWELSKQLRSKLCLVVKLSRTSPKCTGALSMEIHFNSNQHKTSRLAVKVGENEQKYLLRVTSNLWQLQPRARNTSVADWRSIHTLYMPRIKKVADLDLCTCPVQRIVSDFALHW